MDAKGRKLASGTQTHSTTEASVAFTPRADGDYYLRVRDLNSKGGPTSVYHIEADFARPDFTLRCDGDKAMIGPGTSAAWFVHIDRQHGFKEPVDVVVEGLPKGFTASRLTIPPTMTQGVMVISAAKDIAPKTIAHVRVLGKAKAKHDGKEETLVREAAVQQEIYAPGGGRQTFFVNMQTVAVTRPSDVMKVHVKPTRIALKPGESAKIEVTIDRRADFKKRVSLDIPLKHLNRVYGNPLPPGVTIVTGQSKTALGTGDKGHIVIKAAANAQPIDNVPISVLAHVSINFVVKVSYSSEPILVTVVGNKKK